jgi:hypothetical protein
VQHGLVDLDDPVTNGLPLYVPYRGRIVTAKARVRVAPGTAAAVLKLGTTADDDAFATGLTIPTTASAGDEYDFSLDGASAAVVSRGVTLVVTGDGGATATGSVDLLVIVQPDGAA